MQAYSDPSRENDPYSLPDVEVFEIKVLDILCSDPGDIWFELLCESRDVPHNDRKSWLSMCQFTSNDTHTSMEENLGEIRADAEQMIGWYYWYCLPGCLPDSDPYGPFPTAEAALTECRETTEE